MTQGPYERSGHWLRAWHPIRIPGSTFKAAWHAEQCYGGQPTSHVKGSAAIERAPVGRDKHIKQIHSTSRQKIADTVNITSVNAFNTEQMIGSVKSASLQAIAQNDRVRSRQHVVHEFRTESHMRVFTTFCA